MKKILFLHAGSELYGADIVMLELIKGINKEKFYPIVMLPNDGPLVEKLKAEKIEVIVEKYPILRRKYYNIKGIITYLINYMKYSKRISKYIKSNNIDIVHINTSAVLEGYYLHRKNNVKIIWHIHEILIKPKFIAKIIYKIIAKSADKVICVSKAVKEHFQTITKRSDVIVIYNGVDNNKFKPIKDIERVKKEFCIKDNDIVVGMVGRINAWKGQMDFLKAMELVTHRIPNVRILLVGGVFEGEEWRKEEIEKYIKSSINSEKIVIKDFREDVAQIYNIMDIFVLPSTNPDPLPTVVLEAMACGKPIVGYKHGGICEMVEENENGLFAEVRNIEDLGNKIAKLIEDQNVRYEMGKKSLERQKNMFSIESYIKNFEEVYGD